MNDPIRVNAGMSDDDDDDGNGDNDGGDEDDNENHDVTVFLTRSVVKNGNRVL